jgi:hypothetical protein
MGGREVVWRWGCIPTDEAQASEEFGVGVAEHVGWVSSTEERPTTGTTRLVLGEPIGPPRSSLLHLVNRHPDDSLMRKVLSPHGQTLPGTKNALTFRSIVSDIGLSQLPSC